MTAEDASSVWKSFLVGLAFLAGGLWFWNHTMEGALNDILILRDKSTTTGRLVDIVENEAEDERGRVYFSDVGVYDFKVEGKTFKTLTRKPTGKLNNIETIEFLRRNPTVNRVAGDGAQTVFEWSWRKLGLGIVLLGMFSAPGIVQLNTALGEYRRRRNKPLE